jgi:hypothetical protein
MLGAAEVLTPRKGPECQPRVMSQLRQVGQVTRQPANHFRAFLMPRASLLWYL